MQNARGGAGSWIIASLLALMTMIGCKDNMSKDLLKSELINVDREFSRVSVEQEASVC